MRKNNLILFLYGTGLWYIIEFIFRMIINHELPSIITCCIAGFALVLINIYTNQVRCRPLMGSFNLAIIITCSEYLLGYTYWKLFSSYLWYYGGMFLNLYGFICFKYFMIWWIISFIFISVFYKYKKKNIKDKWIGKELYI